MTTTLSRDGAARQAWWRRLALSLSRLLAIVLVLAFALWLVARVLPGVTVGGFLVPIGVSIGMLVAALLVWPLFIRLFFKFVIWTAGFVTIAVSGFIVEVASWLSSGLEVDNFGWAVLYGLLANILLAALLGLISFQDTGTFKRIVLFRQRRRIDPEIVGKPGVVFVEIDGLAHDALKRAMAAGKTPTISRWAALGSHILVPWETDLSSQTSASQAGILHGDNAEIPAFRWLDKQSGKVIVSSNIKILGPFEAAHSNGDGLLAHGGTARASMLSGDASEVMLVASRPVEERGESYRAFFASPLSFSHTTMLMFWEVFLETGSKWSQRLRNMQPRVDRHLKYAFVRAGMTVGLRDLSLNGVMGDMLKGAPYSYVTLAGYDEVAHHSGLDRHDTLVVLRKIDSRLRSLENIARLAPRDYRFVVLADHGQTMGATFLQRYGQDLEALVRESVTPSTTVGGPSTYAQTGAGAGVAKGQSDWEHIATVDIAARESGLAEGRVGKWLEKRLKAGDPAPTSMTDVVVMASGNLGLVSFTGPKHRLTLEEIEHSQPALIWKLVEHPGVGFVMVAAAGDGAGTETVVIGEKGRHYLSDDRVEGEDPLTVYGPNSARHLRRTSSFRNCPDLLVMSTYWPDTGENAAFEELVGNHGGLGGEQTHPFLLYPKDWVLIEPELIGAQSVYRNLKHWTTTTK